MVNERLLKATLVAAGSHAFIGDLAQTLECTRATASRKASGKRGFLDWEIAKIAKRYNLTPEQTFEIFLQE